MENTLLITLSRQGALRRQLDVVANNLANMNTTGFKAQRMMFTEHLVESRGGERLLGEKLSFVHDQATRRDFSEGAIEATGAPLDVAIRGEGWFVIDTPSGRHYTRNGRFRIDAEGRMVTESGNPVVGGAGQPIRFAPTDGEISIARDGTVSAESGELGRLRIVRFDNPQRLRAVVDGLFASDQTPQDVDQPEVVQGMLESSNVEPILEMARMINVHRAYDTARKLVDREDQRIRKMVEEYAR